MFLDFIGCVYLFSYVLVRIVCVMLFNFGYCFRFCFGVPGDSHWLCIVLWLCLKWVIVVNCWLCFIGLKVYVICVVRCLVFVVSLGWSMFDCFAIVVLLLVGVAFKCYCCEVTWFVGFSDLIVFVCFIVVFVCAYCGLADCLLSWVCV